MDPPLTSTPSASTKKVSGGVRRSAQVPDEITGDPTLSAAIASLPANYNFEVCKTIWRVRSLGARRVALQMPEGLLLFAPLLADIIESFSGADVVIMGDVTYGACCVDDLTAAALGAHLLVHYGHSCLVPVTETAALPLLYVFVGVSIDVDHLVRTVHTNFDPEQRLALVSTVQFVASLQLLRRELETLGFQRVLIPQARPLSPGEILGCTAPRLTVPTDAILYVGDGRFHLEAMMMANPGTAAYTYNPYSKKMTREHYAYDHMCGERREAIGLAATATTFGLILGTLGRQGSPKVMLNLARQLKEKQRDFVIVLLSEIFPEKLKLFAGVEAWVQVACPRLSIDWGAAFHRPLLTPYEATVSLKNIHFQEHYPMDYYALESLGPWTNNNTDHRPKHTRRPRVTISRE